MHPSIKNISFAPAGATGIPIKPTLKDWTAKRSGASQTVDGFNGDGKPIKITDVARVKRTAGRTFALDARGAVLAYLAD